MAATAPAALTGGRIPFPSLLTTVCLRSVALAPSNHSCGMNAEPSVGAGDSSTTVWACAARDSGRQGVETTPLSATNHCQDRVLCDSTWATPFGVMSSAVDVPMSHAASCRPPISEQLKR